MGEVQVQTMLVVSFSDYRRVLVIGATLVVQLVKNLPAKQETWVYQVTNTAPFALLCDYMGVSCGQPPGVQGSCVYHRRFAVRHKAGREGP